MNIYLIWQTVNTDYDTYDSAVVIAESEDEAKRIHPTSLEYPTDWQTNDSYSCWAMLKDIQCELIGKAKDGAKKEIICASFNAG